MVAWITEEFASPSSAMFRKVTFSSATVAPGSTLTPGASVIVKLVTVVPANHAALVTGLHDELLGNGNASRVSMLCTDGGAAADATVAVFDGAEWYVYIPHKCSHDSRLRVLGAQVSAPALRQELGETLRPSRGGHVRTGPASTSAQTTINPQRRRSNPTHSQIKANQASQHTAADQACIQGCTRSSGGRSPGSCTHTPSHPAVGCARNMRHEAECWVMFSTDDDISSE